MVVCIIVEVWLDILAHVSFISDVIEVANVDVLITHLLVCYKAASRRRHGSVEETSRVTDGKRESGEGRARVS